MNAIRLVAAGTMGLVAIYFGFRARGAGWFPVLLASASIGVIGPLVTLAMFRDRPDAFVFGGTALALVPPVMALAYSVVGDRRLGSETE